jgi:hypothetical protein
VVEQDDPTALPPGVSPSAHNIRFHLTSARSRDGLQSSFGMVTGQAYPITGLDALKLGGNPDLNVPVVFDQNGNLYKESPVGSGTLVAIVSTQVTPPAAAHMRSASAYKKGYFAFTTLKNAAGPGGVYDISTGRFDPLSMRPFGYTWTKATTVPVGEVWCPTVAGGNAHTFRCTTAGVTGNAEPAWSTGTGTTTNDGTVVWTETTAVMASDAGAGNICAGQRYMVVLFVDRNGYITGMSEASVISANIAANGKKLDVGPIALGPSPQTAARILAFTPAGQLSQVAGTGITSAGPYFWIPPAFPNGIFDLSTIAAGVTVADVVNGVTENSTLINDNVTTNVVLNFDDNYLKLTLNDISSYFRKIQVPNLVDVYYSKNLKRMFYSVDSLPSGWYASEIDDPETVFGNTSILQVAENNGEKRVAVRDYGTVTYALKERSGHIIDSDQLKDTTQPPDPDNWDAKEVWSGSGPCGPKAIDVCTTFMCYVHRSGVYVFFGSKPQLISKEIPITWSLINWAFQHLIAVTIDDTTREIYISVPYNGSQTNNLVLKCNYEESPDFAPPIHFSPYVGKEIATGNCYKWSFDDISANVIMRAERPLASVPAGIDQACLQSQLLWASSTANGKVYAQLPGQTVQQGIYNDDGAFIDSYYETACPSMEGQKGEQLLYPSQLGGVQANVDGVGITLLMEVLALRAKDPAYGGVASTAGAVIPLKKRIQAGIPFSCGGRAQNERFRARITTNKVVNTCFDIKYLAIFAKKIASARPA